MTLIAFLKENKLTKKEIGTNLNLSQPTIKKYVNNPKLFTFFQLRLIADMAKKPMNEFLELCFKSRNN